MRNVLPKQCDHKVTNIIYNANGLELWCGRCHTPLNFDPDARRLNLMVLVPLFLAVAIVVAFFLVVNSGIDRSGPSVVPTPYGNPPVVHSIP